MATVIHPQQTPREVPLRVWVALLVRNAPYLLLSTAALVLGLGLIVDSLSQLNLRSHAMSLNTVRSVLFDGTYSSAEAQMLEVKGTSICVGRCSGANEIFEYRYQYTANQQTLTGVVYGLESSGLKMGKPLTVMYRVETPDWSRIYKESAGGQEPRSQDFALPVILCLFGVIFLVFQIRTGLNQIRWLKQGVVVWGTEVKNGSIDAPLRSFTFKTWQSIETTAQVYIGTSRRSKGTEKLVYDYRRPQIAVSFESLTKMQQVFLDTGQLDGPVQPFKSPDKTERADDADELEDIHATMKQMDTAPKTPAKKTSMISALVSMHTKIAILGCMAALGIFEFKWLLSDKSAEDVFTFGIKQVMLGVFIMSGFSLENTLLRDPKLIGISPSSQPNLAQRAGVWVSIAGLVALISGLAGLVYLAYLESNDKWSPPINLSYARAAFVEANCPGSRRHRDDMFLSYVLSTSAITLTPGKPIDAQSTFYISTIVSYASRAECEADLPRVRAAKTPRAVWYEPTNPRIFRFSLQPEPIFDGVKYLWLGLAWILVGVYVWVLYLLWRRQQTLAKQSAQEPTT